LETAFDLHIWLMISFASGKKCKITTGFIDMNHIASTTQTQA